MFSGGLLSRNIASQRNRVRRKAAAKKRQQKKQSPELSNWSDKPDAKDSNNQRPTYLLRVPGKLRLVSVGGGLVIAGTLILVASLLSTWMLRSVFYGPIGIGIGIFTDLVSITWILEERNSHTRIYHIRDIYAPHATSKMTTDINLNTNVKENDNNPRNHEKETLIGSPEDVYTVCGAVPQVERATI